MKIGRRERVADLSWYGFPPRRRPIRLGVVLARVAIGAGVALGLLVASGAIR